LLAVRESGNTLEQLVDCLSRSSLGFDFIEFEPDPPAKPRLYPRSNRRYSCDCGRAEGNYELADVGIAGRVSADTCDTHPAFAQLLVNSKQLGLDFVADPLGIVRRRQQRQLDLIQVHCFPPSVFTLARTRAATGTDYPIRDIISAPVETGKE
jgi:hypothetical protein